MGAGRIGRLMVSVGRLLVTVGRLMMTIGRLGLVLVLKHMFGVS